MKRCCNIDRQGRIFRLVLGLILIGNAIGMASMGIPGSGWFTHVVHIMLALIGAFAIYEAAVGWCLARALGIKTRI